MIWTSGGQHRRIQQADVVEGSQHPAVILLLCYPCVRMTSMFQDSVGNLFER
jgi:hypothetical protein